MCSSGVTDEQHERSAQALLVLGLDVTIVKQFHIIPTFHTVIYDAVGDEEAPDTDFVPRLTFSVTF